MTLFNSRVARWLSPAALAAAALSLSIQAAAPAPIYPDPSAAQADVTAGLAQAAKEHKRVIIDFGGNWCGDCKVLDANFHKPENVSLLDANFILVHVNIGLAGVDQNLDVAKRFNIPLDKGVPALAVVDDSGKLLFSQQHGEFEDMRHMDAQSVNDFLNKWKT